MVTLVEPQGEATVILQNIRNYLLDDKVAHSRRHEYSTSFIFIRYFLDQ